MKEVKHIKRALELLQPKNEPTMQFGGRRHGRYQPYPQKSRPKTYKARTFHRVRPSLLGTGAHRGQPPRLKFEIEFEVCGIITIHNEERVNVRVLDIKQYDRLGNREYSTRAQHIGKEVQIARYTTTRPERHLLRRVLILTQEDGEEIITNYGDTGFLDQISWYIDYQYDTLYSIALEKSQSRLPIQSTVHKMKSLQDFAKASLTADTKVIMAEHNPELYWRFTDHD